MATGRDPEDAAPDDDAPGSGTSGSGASSDGASSDPWDGFVFDEEFIKGGVHEPPARTRESIARYGGQRTSWRQGAILEPTTGKRRGGRRRWRIILVSVAVLAMIVGFSWFALDQKNKPVIPNSYNEPTPGVVQVETTESAETVVAETVVAEPAGVEPMAAETGSAESTATDLAKVEGMEPYDLPGSCYFDPQTVVPGEAHTLDLNKVDCDEPHNYELVLIQLAADTADGTYPADEYWAGPVSRSCEEQLERYTGRSRSEWPDTLVPDFFIPRPEGWAAGDRNIQCMAASTVYLTASVKG